MATKREISASKVRLDEMIDGIDDNTPISHINLIREQLDSLMELAENTNANLDFSSTIELLRMKTRV